MAVGIATGSAAQRQEQPFTLALPLDCKFGETCFIQQYFDHDPSSGMKDYRDGAMTYDGHDGVDLRVSSMAAQRQGVSVLAAASGVIKAVRDGMPDVSVRAIGFNAIAGRECGNGVLIAHERGWETQYCHLARGSVQVKPGQRVKTGVPIGLVGLSGQTEFPHLHFSVGRNGVMVDPFAADASEGCAASRPLWSASAARSLAYHSPTLINYGFSAETVSINDVEVGRAGSEHPVTDSPVLIAFVRAIGLRANDVQRFTLRGPNGDVIARSENPPLDSNMAERFMYVGKRRPSLEWPRGTYEAEFEVLRDGTTVLSRRFSFEMR